MTLVSSISSCPGRQLQQTPPLSVPSHEIWGKTKSFLLYLTALPAIVWAVMVLTHTSRLRGSHQLNTGKTNKQECWWHKPFFWTEVICQESKVTPAEHILFLIGLLGVWLRVFTVRPNQESTQHIMWLLDPWDSCTLVECFLQASVSWTLKWDPIQRSWELA